MTSNIRRQAPRVAMSVIAIVAAVMAGSAPAAPQDEILRSGHFTVSIEGVRFEVPSRYRHLERLSVRYATWDLGRVHLVDARTGTLLAPLYPLDRAKNADGMRRVLGPVPAGGFWARTTPASPPTVLWPYLTVASCSSPRPSPPCAAQPSLT